MKAKKLAQSQKVRLVMNGLHFYSTIKAIRSGIGDEYRTNAAAQKALLVLEAMREDQSAACGLAGTWEGINVQIDII